MFEGSSYLWPLLINNNILNYFTKSEHFKMRDS